MKPDVALRIIAAALVFFVLFSCYAVFSLSGNCEEQKCNCASDSLKVESMKREVEILKLKYEKDSVIFRIRNADPTERSSIWSELGY